MSESTLIPICRLGLTKLYLWPEADRIQTYPQALARLVAHPEFDQGATRRQIGEHLFRLAYVKGRHPLRENVLTNIFGVAQIANDKLVLRGINLFRRAQRAQPRPIAGSRLLQWETQDDLWLPTSEAIALGHAYAADSDGSHWQAILAEQIGRYEVRTRLLLSLLAQGRRLVFAENSFFGVPHQKAQLIGAGETISLFDQESAAFDELLKARRLQAIGPWWLAEIASLGYALQTEFALEAVSHKAPSTNDLSYNLRNGLTVFKHLGILADLGDGWGLDLSVIERYLSSDLLADLTGSTRPVLVSDALQALRQAVNELADESGFVVTSQLVDRWAELQGLPPTEVERRFDDFIRHNLYEDHVRVLDSHPGQPRLGRGLLGNADQRRLRLSIANG